MTLPLRLVVEGDLYEHPHAAFRWSVHDSRAASTKDTKNHFAGDMLNRGNARWMWPLPNQSTLPPTVRTTYCTGNPCGPFQSGNGRVDPNQPLTVFVDGFSSLSGMQSLEVDPAYSFLCSNGSVAQSGQADTIPTKTTASNQTLRLSLEVDVGTPQDHWCQNSDIPFSSWSGNFKATAVSKNGLSTTATLALQAP